MTSPAPEPTVTMRPYEAARLELNRVVDDAQLSLIAALRRICAIAADTLQVERVGVWLLSDDHALSRCVNLYERSQRLHGLGPNLVVAEYPIYFGALRQRRALPCELVQSDPRAAELRESYLVPLGITSMLDVPLLRGEELLGVVCHEHVGPPREWTTEDRDFAMAVGDAVGYRLKLAEAQAAAATARERPELFPEGDRFQLVGRLAAGVAHDFRNLLTVIIGNAALLLRHPQLTDEMRARLQQILDVGERGTELVRNLLEFGRDPAGTPRVLPLADAISRFLPLIQSGLGSAWNLVFRSEAGSIRVLIDPSHLERIVLNLLLNAKEAMPRGGTIEVRLTTQTTSNGTAPAGEYACLEVRDQGGGIPPGQIERIFDIGYTTKGSHQGGGLGLAIVRRLVERAGGFIRVQSTPGEGTTMQVFLPRVSH